MAEMANYTLYGYFRSSTSYRVRIALALKGIPYESRSVHLLNDGGEQYAEAYRHLNPMGEVPTLCIHDDDGQLMTTMSQSVAIMEYLEECHPEPALLPASAELRARVRQVVEVINSSIHPIQNIKVMKRLSAEFGTEREDNFRWAAYWIDRGFIGLEALMQRTAGLYAVGDSVTLADVALVPQVFNARRFGVDMDQFPTLVRIDDKARALEAFKHAAPEHQPDAV